MSTTSVYDAKTQLSRLIDRALAGEDVVIARSGRPVVRLVPVAEEEASPRSGRGAWRGRVRVRIADDFDELPEEVAAALHGERA